MVETARPVFRSRPISAARPAPPPRHIAGLLVAAVWLVYLTTAGGTLGTGDAVAMFDVADAIVTRGAMDVPAEQSAEGWRGVDGRYYSPFGIGQPLYDLPFMLAGRALAKITGIQLGDRDGLPKAFVAMASTIPAAIAVGFGFLLAYRLSADARASLGTALVLAFGTLLWPYSKFGFNAALTTGALAGGVYGIAAGWLDRRPSTLAAGGIGLGVAILTRHEMSLAAVVCLAWLAWQSRRTAHRWTFLIAGSTGTIVALGVWLMLNYVRFHNPLFTGHRPAFAIAGAWAFIVSPSGAFVLYSPVSIAVVGLAVLAWRQDATAQLLALVSAVLVVFYASLDDWLGTRSYGPRYLVPLLPLFVAPFAVWWSRARRSQRFALSALCLVSVLVQIPGVVVDFSRAGVLAGQPPQTVRRDDWRWSPIRLNAWLAARAVPANIQYVSGRADPPPASARGGAVSLSERLSFSLDFWWLYLFYLRLISRAAVFAAALLPTAVATALFGLAYRNTR